jgi:hypothetical protein
MFKSQIGLLLFTFAPGVSQAQKPCEALKVLNIDDHILGEGTRPGDPTKKLTRPLCPYPEVARYKGTGDPYDAKNFECAVSGSAR